MPAQSDPAIHEKGRPYGRPNLDLAEAGGLEPPSLEYILRITTAKSSRTTSTQARNSLRDK